jgi:3'(2'), 5'-bisphosphate nucleotidase
MDPLDHAKKIALEAGELLLFYYKKKEEDLGIQYKTDRSPVTQADQEADRLITGYLERETPYPVLSEETYNRDLWPRAHRDETYWLLDPLDGTKEFIAKTDEFCVSLALISQRAPILGVIYSPVGGALFYGQKGLGAYKTTISGLAQPLQVQTNRHPPIIVASRRHKPIFFAKIQDTYPQSPVHHLGSALKFCFLAEGLGDIYPRPSPISIWDTAAGECLLREAGGWVRGWDGQDLSYDSQVSLFSSGFIAGRGL